MKTISRRQFATIAGSGLLINTFSTVRAAFALPLDSAQKSAAIQARFHQIETIAQGRLGVHILDTSTGEEWGYRSDERFLMLSTFKFLASALVLHRVDAGKESLERRIRYTAKDLVSWSPVTEKHVDDDGMTLGQLCEAAITISDNAAANLILSSYGGPAVLTAFAKNLGDRITRLDRNEPALNVPTLEGLMDTTSPRAMLHLMQKILLGDALSAHSRRQLQQWLLANTTGNRRLKAGLLAGWLIGDKTGTNKTGANDIGIVYPPNRKPFLVSAYLTESKASEEVKDAAIASIGEVLVDIAR